MDPIAPEDYEPRYASISAVPIEVEDSYPDEKKRVALFQAENQLELDRNGGVELDTSDITNAHISAVLNLATYHLVRSATSNQDVTLGDLDDGGEQTERHAEQYKKTYDDIVERLSEAGPNGQSGTYFGATGGRGQSIAVNSGSSARRHRLNTSTNRDPVHDRYVGDN